MSNVHGRARRAALIHGLSCLASGLAACLAAGAEPALAQALGLPEVLAHADRHAPAIVAARALSGLGDAAMAGAQPTLRDNPELELGAGPRTTVGAHPTVDLKLRVQQRIELGGQRRARIAAAHSVRSLQDERIAAIRFATRVGTRGAFHRALLEHERARSARQIEEVQAHVRELAEGRLEAGDIGPLGVRLAEADLAQSTQARIAAEGGEQVALLQLAAIAGLSVDPLPSLTGRLPTPLASIDVGALIASARAAQPARRIALAELAEREQRARVASKEGSISPTIGLELAHEDGNQNVALATISLPLPLFAQNQGARAQARAEHDVTQAELDALDQALPVRVRTWAVAVQTAATRIAVFERDVLPRFQENLALIDRAFELGELDALEVSTARARLVAAQWTALDGCDDYLEALTNLQLETGVELPVGTSR